MRNGTPPKNIANHKSPLAFIADVGHFCELILTAWAFVLFTKPLAEIQGYQSAWKGLGNIRLSTVVVIVVPFALLVGVSILLHH